MGENYGQSSDENNLSIHFGGKYGQIEIGGKYIGAEFHHSRPLPSRISFYYPVANSIDLSTSYWKRYESNPFLIILNVEGEVDTLGIEPLEYSYTPFNATFIEPHKKYEVTYNYQFCDSLPVMVLQIQIKNLTEESQEFIVFSSLVTTLRTSHSFTIRNKAIQKYIRSGSIALTSFDEVDTDSALIFIANAGEMSIPQNTQNEKTANEPLKNPQASFSYTKQLNPEESMNIIQLIGSCRQSESERVLDKAMKTWREEVQRNSMRVSDYVFKQSKFYVTDPALQQTANWSKAILASNKHYIDEWIIPMPCPAEYNFFFTHDLLLTGLGAVLFDINYVKNGYQFLQSLAKADSILPHAYYWKDNGYNTEYCNSDNWNHLWFIISLSSYLKHSGDIETVQSLYPVASKSLQLMIENKGSDDLMYASRPDWWDIGNVYGARAYISSLMIKALQDYVFLSSQLGKVDDRLIPDLTLAETMKTQLVNKLWNDDKNFLMNMMIENTVDPHYYSGSLIAAAFDILDTSRRTKLLESAEENLLDQNLGIRNAMPPDFQGLVKEYQFKEGEVGEPYYYFNGAVWPQGIVWYVLGLISDNQPNQAKQALKKYLTVSGIMNSPSGQPSFFEYRVTDPESPRYGEIDKPTFLWAAGWYLHALYRLCGLQENSWNISFNPNLSNDLDNPEYDLTIYGKLCRVKWEGEGKYFKRIEFDNKRKSSAIISSPVQSIVLERGQPDQPYLASATCMVGNAYFNDSNRLLSLDIRGLSAQKIRLKVISPMKVKNVDADGLDIAESLSSETDDKVLIYTLVKKMSRESEKISFYF
jgi:glycogen debranching enzyme